MKLHAMFPNIAAILGAAPCAAAVHPEHPHKKGREAIVLKVEGAPPTQDSCTGERPPTSGQGHVACSRDLDPGHEALR